MVVGLRWEPLEHMLQFLTSDEKAMIDYSLPGDDVNAVAVGILTPFGTQWRAKGPAPPVPPPKEMAVYEHCGGLLQLTRAAMALGATSAGYTETANATRETAAGG